MAVLCHFSVLSFSLLLLNVVQITQSQPYIGVNYGQVADNLPPPESTAKLLQTTTISKIRLYNTDPAIIKALANTNIGIVIGAANGDIPALANDPSFAKSWVTQNVVAYPASNIILVMVGNEVLSYGDSSMIGGLLSAMQNVQNALDAAGLGRKVQVSTVHSMALLKTSEPPSAGSFDMGFADVLKGLLGFNNATGSPFAINPYPYFAYRDDPRPETLKFCLFEPNEGRDDPNTKIKYMNMFDAQVDAIRSALNSIGFKDVEIVVAETGWPYKGDSDEVGPSLEYAKAYNGNLVSHLRSMVGTPLMPGKSVDTYMFALYDENLKPGRGSERSFGIYKPDLTMTYDIGISKSNTKIAPASAPVSNASVSTAPNSTSVGAPPTTPGTSIDTAKVTPNNSLKSPPKASASSSSSQKQGIWSMLNAIIDVSILVGVVSRAFPL